MLLVNPIDNLVQVGVRHQLLHLSSSRRAEKQTQN